MYGWFYRPKTIVLAEVVKLLLFNFFSSKAIRNKSVGKVKNFFRKIFLLKGNKPQNRRGGVQRTLPQELQG